MKTREIFSHHEKISHSSPRRVRSTHRVIYLNGAQGAPYILLAPPEYLIVRFHAASANSGRMRFVTNRASSKRYPVLRLRGYFMLAKQASLQ